jgi:hypothetical protein
MRTRIPLILSMVAVLISTTGCNLLVNNQNVISQEIDKIRAQIFKADWKAVDDMMMSDFTFTNYLNKKYDTRAGKNWGKRYFMKSFTLIPQHKALYMDPVNFVRISDTQYKVGIDARLTIYGGPDGQTNLTWKTEQLWKKEGEVWKLAAVIDRGAKLSNSGRNFDEAYVTKVATPKPVAKKPAPKPAAKPAAKKSSGGSRGGVAGTASQAMQTKKRFTDKVK